MLERCEGAAARAALLVLESDGAAARAALLLLPLALPVLLSCRCCRA
jgi:hypothetical protein